MSVMPAGSVSQDPIAPVMPNENPAGDLGVLDAGVSDTAQRAMGALGVKRLPPQAYSGSSVFNDVISYGLGYNLEDKLDPHTAAERIRAYQRASSAIRDSGLPDPPPSLAVQLGRQQLEKAEADLYAVQTNFNSYMPAPMDQAAQQGLFDRMFAQSPEAKVASFQDVPEEMRAFALGMAVVQALRGNLGGAGQTLATPLRMAQGQMDVDRQNRAGEIDLDRKRAAAEYNAQNQLREEQVRSGMARFTADERRAANQYSIAQQHYNKILLDSGKQLSVGERQLRAKLASGATSNDKMLALQQLFEEGFVDENEYANLLPFATMKTPKDLETEANVAKKGAETEKIRVQTEYIPKEYQLGVQRHEETKRRNKVNEDQAKERLGISREANEIRLRIAEMRGGRMASREVSLRGATRHSDLAAAVVRASKSGNTKGLAGEWERKIGILDKERQNTIKEYNKVTSAVNNTPPGQGKEALVAYRRELANRLDDLNADISELREEQQRLKDPAAAKAKDAKAKGIIDHVKSLGGLLGGPKKK